MVEATSDRKMAVFMVQNGKADKNGGLDSGVEVVVVE
jgi:hypothetical protein